MKIAVFHHIYQVNNWESLSREQYSRVMSSGLGWKADLIHFGLNGDKEFHFPQLSKPFPRFESKINENQEQHEACTLKDVLKFAEENPGYKIFYFHTKGVSYNPVPTPIRDWRRMMEHFCIDKWEDCVGLLDEYGAIGCNYLEETGMGRFPHFSGNFWWATSEHIRELDHSYLDHPNRMYNEFWIGSNNSDKMHEVYRALVNMYHEEYPEAIYLRESRES